MSATEPQQAPAPPSAVRRPPPWGIWCLAAGLLSAFLFSQFWATNPPGDKASSWDVITFFGAPAIGVVGTVLGLISLFVRGSHRGLALVGLAFNGIVLLSIVAIAYALIGVAMVLLGLPW